MMIEDKILLTARYAEGDLNEAEQAVFESRLQNDEELKQHLTDYNYIHQSLKIEFALSHGDQLFKDSLKTLNQQYFAQETKTVSFKPYLKWIGAIAAVLVIGLMLWAPWNANFYDQYAGNGQMLVTERGAEKETELDKAAAFYNEKKFVEAQSLLQKLNAQQANNPMIGFYYAQTLIHTGNLSKAREILETLYNGETVFKYDAAYAMAMSYLKENKKEECKLWLKKIPSGTANSQKAQELLPKL